MQTVDRQSERLSKKIKEKIRSLLKRLDNYINHLFFPIYLFPIKLITYFLYYLAKFSIKFLLSLVKLIFESIIFPFRSLKNLLKAIFFVGVTLYMLASLFVIADYLRNQYGIYGKFFCSYGINNYLKKSVVRVVGGYSEGSGFFVEPDMVITNFHVIADEPSPKIIFPDGQFITSKKIIGNKDIDMAILFTEKQYKDYVLALPDLVELSEEEILISAGYPLGTALSGKATLVKGRFIDYRNRNNFLQTDISLVEGMSGGPLVDQCGKVVGINTSGLAGLSMFISADSVKKNFTTFTDQNIKKIEVDAGKSPEEAVKAFYTYLKARKMEDGFKLLSREYLLKTNFEEWTARFADVLDVSIFISKPFEKTDDTVFVKFSTKNWIDGEVAEHFYEGTWATVKEDGVYKMLKSKIKEVENPSWEWFYE